MGDGFQFIDIIFFAMIAAFLALRLRSVLGRRDGHEGGYRDPFKRVPEPDKAPDERAEDNVVRLPDRSAAADDAKLKEAAHGDDTLAAGLVQIKLADPSFDPDAFLAGARAAFEMILEAFATGDTSTLKSMLSADVYANFSQAIKGRHATVTAKIVSEQINATVNGKNDVVSGDLNKVIDVTDFWTFQRDTRSRDPNWTLIATRSLE
jgi:predicted lipid-binding transport protein (Tim44 family)